MPKLLYRTKNDVFPEKMPRVFFTCHPLDFEYYFDSVCKALFEANNCAVYYTANLEQPFSQEELETDLGRMNLFVVPVTHRLLTSSSWNVRT